MRLLLDSHTLIWSVDQQQRLGANARAAVSDPANELLLSAAIIWEIAIKVGLAIGPVWMSVIVGSLAALVLGMMIFQLIKRPIRQVLTFSS